jgi:hypothetical protein
MRIISTAPLVDPDLVAVLHDLEAIAVEFRSCSQSAPFGGDLAAHGIMGEMNAGHTGHEILCELALI